MKSRKVLGNLKGKYDALKVNGTALASVAQSAELLPGTKRSQVRFPGEGTSPGCWLDLSRSCVGDS